MVTPRARRTSKNLGNAAKRQKSTDQKLLVKQLKLDLCAPTATAHHRAGGEANARGDTAGVVETGLGFVKVS
jgi:hypothetical protein